MLEHRLIAAQSTGPQLSERSAILENLRDPQFELVNGVLYRRNRRNHLCLVVPANLVDNITRMTHETIGHRGIGKTVEAIQRNYWFENMTYIVEKHIKECLTCLTHTPNPNGQRNL